MIMKYINENNELRVKYSFLNNYNNIIGKIHNKNFFIFFMKKNFFF